MVDIEHPHGNLYVWLCSLLERIAQSEDCFVLCLCNAIVENDQLGDRELEQLASVFVQPVLFDVFLIKISLRTAAF